MVTIRSDRWTEELCKKLIMEYRKRPVLWDHRSPIFYKKQLKPEAWEAIGQALNRPPDQCRHKMVVLMSSFRREKAKILNSKKEDSSNVYQSSWFAFKYLSFLMDKESERQRQLEGFIITEEDNETPSNSLSNCSSTSESGSQSDINRTSNKRHSQLGNNDNKKRKQFEDDVDAQEQSNGHQSSNVNEEEINYFANFIASKMKKYSEATKNAVQQAICEIIFKADQNCYEDTDSLKVNNDHNVAIVPLKFKEEINMENVSDDDSNG